MSGSPGSPPRWLPHARNLQDFLGRWSSPVGNLRSVLEGVIPVALVDRFRDDTEGSVFGLSASTPGVAGFFPAVAWGSAVNDWELHQLWFRSSLAPVLRIPAAHLFTPIDPYNPVATPAPVGFFVPGLLLNKPFTLGSVTAVAGGNAALAPIIGPVLDAEFAFDSGAPGLQLRYPIRTGGWKFDPPIRVYRGVTLALQGVEAIPAFLHPLEVEILYTERPRVTRGP